MNVYNAEVNRDFMLNLFNSFSPWIKLGILSGIIISISFGWGVSSNYIIEANPLINLQIETSEITLLSNGTFVKIDNAHMGSGLVEIIQTTNNEIQLLFKDVKIVDGPGLYVYLSTKPSFTGTADSPGTFVNLGELPALTGSFSMNIVGVTNIDDYKSVLIWCEPFEVVFTYATLNPVEGNMEITSPAGTTSSNIASTFDSENMVNTGVNSEENIVVSDENPLSIKFIMIFVLVAFLPLVRKKRKLM